MNVKVLQWLLKNQSVLRKVADVASGWKSGATYAEKWAIIDSIARLLIPVIETDKVEVKELLDSDGGVRFLSNMEEEVVSLGIDWVFVKETVIPIVIMILQVFASK